jgi:hypothetical protein
MKSTNPCVAQAVMLLVLFRHAEVVYACTASCQPMPLHGFVTLARSDLASSAELREPSSAPESSDAFRFLSFNAPNLLRIETNSNSILLPSRDEIWDIICSIQQMGGKVTYAPQLSQELF